jgi:hypothetical protein
LGTAKDDATQGIVGDGMELSGVNEVAQAFDLA